MARRADERAATVGRTRRRRTGLPESGRARPKTIGGAPPSAGDGTGRGGAEGEAAAEAEQSPDGRGARPGRQRPGGGGRGEAAEGPRPGRRGGGRTGRSSEARRGTDSARRAGPDAPAHPGQAALRKVEEPQRGGVVGPPSAGGRLSTRFRILSATGERVHPRICARQIAPTTTSSTVHSQNFAGGGVGLRRARSSMRSFSGGDGGDGGAGGGAALMGAIVRDARRRRSVESSGWSCSSRPPARAMDRA